MDIEKRRQSDRERYWRDVDNRRSKRRVANLTADEVNRIRERDRKRYEANREKILARKKSTREKDPDRVRGYGRNYYWRHPDEARRTNRNSYWRGQEEARRLKDAIKAVREAIKSTHQEKAP